MYTKDEIINGMCLTYRHDFGTMTNDEQDGVRLMMEKLYRHHFYPVLEDLHDDACCACEQCMEVVAKNLKLAMGN